MKENINVNEDRLSNLFNIFYAINKTRTEGSHYTGSDDRAEEQLKNIGLYELYDDGEYKRLYTEILDSAIESYLELVDIVN
jgi:ABC-type cobalt transport system substrate-binding protein